MYVDCPACQTRLQVRAEQLRLARGEVCCSVCQHCFDALARLQDDESPLGLVPLIDPLAGITAETPPQIWSQGMGVADHEEAVVALPEPIWEDEELGEADANPRRAAWWWMALGGVAGALLGVQVLMVFGPRWVADPAWRPLLEWCCARLQNVGANCALPPLVEVRLLALEAHQFTTHPRREGGLLFEAELVNRAPFAQPYPRIRLSVEDPFGGSMAIGTFAPEAYLQQSVDRSALLAPEARVPIHLELLDPGRQAAGYRFELLPPE